MNAMTDQRTNGSLQVDTTTPLRLGGMAKVRSGDIGAGRLPDFLIVGGSKCGTTTLWQYLHRHPGIFLAEPKEPEFFSKDDRFCRGVAWYKALFANARPEQVCGEASTTYSRWPHFGDVPGRIADAAPGVKLVYLLRNPVERTYAQYRHRMRLDVPRMTFEEALEADQVFIDASLYLMQIEKFLERFPRQALLPVLLEDLSQTPGPTLASILQHIGAAPMDVSAAGPIAANQSSEAKGDYVRQRMGRVMKWVPGIGAVKGCVPQSAKNAMKRAITASPWGKRVATGYQPSPLLPQTRRRLVALFEEPNLRLGEFLGRDLSHWSS